MNYATDGDGRIVAAPAQEGPLANITREERVEAIANDFVLEMSNEDHGVTLAPEPKDRRDRAYRTVGGATVLTATTADTEIAFWWCGGCQRRDELGYGWLDVARSRAEAHAATCRAV